MFQNCKIRFSLPSIKFSVFSREEVDVDDKMAKEMVAVGDETGMKDSSDEEEDEEKEDEEKNETKKQLSKLKFYY